MNNHQLVQYLDQSGTRRVGVVVDDATLHPVRATDSVWALMHRALAERRTLAELVDEFRNAEPEDYRAVRADGRVLAPFDHPVDAADCAVWLQSPAAAPLRLGDAGLLRTHGAELPWVTATNDEIVAVPAVAVCMTTDSHGHLHTVGHALAHSAGVGLAVGLGMQLLLGDGAAGIAGARTTRRRDGHADRWSAGAAADTLAGTPQALSGAQPEPAAGDAHVLLYPLHGAADERILVRAGDALATEASPPGATAEHTVVVAS